MVSIVIPSFNHAHFLGQCIESVLAQTVSEWELIIVDDASTDESVELARGYDDARIRLYVNDQNLGTYGTQNRGLELARGEIIAILDSDDFWSPTKLERQLALWSKYPSAVFCYARGAVAGGDETIPASYDPHKDWPTSEVQDLLPLLVHENRVLASSLMFKKGAVRFEPTLRYSGDWLAMVQLASLGGGLFVDEVCCFWRSHPDQSSRKMLEVIREQIRVRLWILNAESQWLKGHSDQAAIRRGLALCALGLHACYVLVGDREGQRKMLETAARLDPTNAMVGKRRLASLIPGALMKRLWPGWDPEPHRRRYHEEPIAPLHIHLDNCAESES